MVNTQLIRRFHKYLVTFCSFFIINDSCAFASNSPSDTTRTSNQKEAQLFIDNIKELKASPFWPGIKPADFLQNVRNNINTPLALYEGSYTNFCGYAVLSYLSLHDDPLGYARNMLQLYEHGKVKWGKSSLSPSLAVRQAAGTFKFKGALDIHPADQLLFLSLADHFKGYLNIFSKNYKPGRENTFWASVNYAKFNRMARDLFNYKVDARGTDLLHPRIHDLFSYIKEKLSTGTTVLYLNNQYLNKKSGIALRPGVPTHYVVLLEMQKSDDLINIIYWDYGFRSLRQISPKFLKKIVFGVTHCTLKKHDDK